MWDTGTLVGVAAMLIAAAAIWYQVQFTQHSIDRSKTPTPLEACLIRSCAARRAAERAACGAAPESGRCLPLVRTDASTNDCAASLFPPTGSPEATAIETSYTQAIGRCYANAGR